MASVNSLCLVRLNEQVWRVVTGQGEHVGNLKRIGVIWKFKAIGYDEQGDVIPGGGPLTQRHNLTFTNVDEAEVNARLGLS